jgi:excisionase family DNA binding protein
LRLFDDADFEHTPGTVDPAAHHRAAVLPDGDTRCQDVPRVREPTDPSVTAATNRASVGKVDRTGRYQDPSPARTAAHDGACQDATRHDGVTTARNVGGTAGCDLLAPRLVTVAVAARLLGVGRTTIYELIAHGDIDTVHIGRAARVPVCSLDAFVSKLQTRAQKGSPSTSATVRPEPRRSAGVRPRPPNAGTAVTPPS